MGKRITQEEFIDICKTINPTLEYSKTMYTGSTHKVIITCSKHGDFEINPNTFLRSGKCPKCNLGIPSNEEFIEKCKKIFPDYDYSKTIYTGRHSKVKVICKNHNYQFEITAGDLLSGHGCPKCKTYKVKKQAFTTSEFIDKAKKVHKNLYDYSKVDYVNNNTKVCIICPEHGEFWQLPSNHLRGTGCPKCFGGVLDSKEIFISKAQKVHGHKYDYSKVLYTNSNTQVIISCPIHGEFLQKPAHHLQAEGCPSCNKSKGEQLIKIWLDSRNINYLAQFKIPIDKTINSSGYALVDFYLPEFNTYIEYNGIQHYVAKDYFGGNLRLKQQQARDQYLRDYCSQYNINLLEIRYDQNVDEMLNEKLTERKNGR